MAWCTLHWMMHAWRRPEHYEAINHLPDRTANHSFSIIVPCRHEDEMVMATTVQRLLDQDHPNFEVIISVGHDDESTVANARRIAARSPRVRVSINDEIPKNKPKQLNTTLLECTKEIVGIMDAESLAAPGLLQRIDTAFSAGADVVQGAVHLVNLRSTWFSLRNCLEYRIWFRSRLHGHAGNGFLPLGGNTVFFRRCVLQEVEGWDGGCLAEDCEIGVRLSVQGRRTVCVYEPGLVTREETPDSTTGFLKQRTRWSLGFMQVLTKGMWRGLPTSRERLAAIWLLSQQFAMAFAGLILPLAILTALWGQAPVPVVLTTFLPLCPTALTLAFELLVLHEFGRDLGIRVRWYDYVWLVLSTPAYQFLLGLAALRALRKFLAADFGWEKTAHRGAHLEAPGVA